jgi:hypothetical protein
VVRTAGWVPVVGFMVWALTALLLAGSWLMRREPHTVASPFDQLRIAGGLPGASATLLKALAVAEATGREFIAEAAIRDPVNNQEATAEFAQSYAAYEAEVRTLIADSDVLDKRWQLLWQRKPSWADAHILEPPFTRERLDTVVSYMAQRNRQLAWMIAFLQGGSDKPVRYIRHWGCANEVGARAEDDETHGERGGSPSA